MMRSGGRNCHINSVLIPRDRNGQIIKSESYQPSGELNNKMRFFNCILSKYKFCVIVSEKLTDLLLNLIII